METSTAQTTQSSYTKDLHLKHVEAFWDGNLEWLNPLFDEWAKSINPPHQTENPARFRIVTPKQLRPWNTTEIPLGAQIRAKGFHDTFLIVGVQKGLIIWNDGCARISSPATIFKDFEHSTNQGKTWLPCGVEE